MAQSPPLLQNTEAHPVALSLLLLRRYGPEWLLWESETLEAKLQEDFGGASRINFEKIQAMKALHLAEEFWTSWEVFAWCTAALNGRLADFEVMQVPTLPECLYSVSCAKHTRDDVPWSGEVAAFVGAVHLHDEVLVPTPPLEFSEVPSLEGHPVDLAKVRARFSKLYSPPAGDSAEDEQLRRMWDLKHLHEQYEQQLALQRKEASHG